MKSKSLIMSPVARLKKIRLYLGMTRQQFGNALAISQYTIRSWENGAKKFTADGIQRVIAALKDKIDFSCSFDWLMYGAGSSPIYLCEANKIQDNFITFVEPSNQSILDEIVSFKKNNRSANVIFISDNTFYPVADAGDYVGLVPVDIASLENYIDKLIFVALKNDQVRFGLLKKRRRSFSVISCLDSSHTSVSKSDIDMMSQFVWFRKMY